MDSQETHPWAILDKKRRREWILKGLAHGILWTRKEAQKTGFSGDTPMKSFGFSKDPPIKLWINGGRENWVLKSHAHGTLWIKEAECRSFVETGGWIWLTRGRLASDLAVFFRCSYSPSIFGANPFPWIHMSTTSVWSQCCRYSNYQQSRQQLDNFLSGYEGQQYITWGTEGLWVLEKYTYMESWPPEP